MPLFHRGSLSAGSEPEPNLEPVLSFPTAKAPALNQEKWFLSSTKTLLANMLTTKPPCPPPKGALSPAQRCPYDEISHPHRLRSNGDVHTESHFPGCCPQRSEQHMLEISSFVKCFYVFIWFYVGAHRDVSVIFSHFTQMV
ncbi:hypothetical protein Q7C36_004451 [Tachysurus vachellii]|uniref:Uncharacterized protein n=1 Tax=Tachysurus vachellii TaxID=175792 RepID=A0AA88NIJ6_TACVA|nr:hypothetical protein Q7C36_004451 [Tachysurus vachellii]